MRRDIYCRRGGERRKEGEEEEERIRTLERRSKELRIERRENYFLYEYLVGGLKKMHSKMGCDVVLYKYLRGMSQRRCVYLVIYSPDRFLVPSGQFTPLLHRARR
jgi:hypothetical protein